MTVEDLARKHLGGSILLNRTFGRQRCSWPLMMCKSFCGLLSRLLNKESKDKWKAAAFHLSLLNVRYKIVQNFERFGGGVFGCGPDHNLSWLQGGWSTPYIVSPASFPPPEPKGPPPHPAKREIVLRLQPQDPEHGPRRPGQPAFVQMPPRR